MPPSDRSDLVLAETERLFPQGRCQWEALRNARIFLTGATGLFGRWLLPAALYANEMLGLNLRLILLTRNRSAFIQSMPMLKGSAAVQWVDGDVRTFEFPSSSIDYVIHGATTSAHETFHGETSLQKFNTLVDGTRHVLDFVRQAGAGRLLFLSSGVVYGSLPETMVAAPEDFSGAPDTTDHRTGLAQAKRAAEYLCVEYAALCGFKAVIARCFSFAGPGLPTNLHYAFGNFVQQALQDEKIVVQSDGLALRSYLYLGDLVNWLLPLLTQPTLHSVYNVGSAEAISIGELARRVGEVVAPNKPVQILGRPAYSVGNSPRNIYVPDVSRIQKEFSVSAGTPLSAMIRLTAQYEQAKLAREFLCSTDSSVGVP